VNTYEQGIQDGRQQILDFLDEFDITELGYGGGYLLKTRIEMPDKSWKGTQHRLGSVAQYIKRGCRCDKCREVTMAYYRERRQIKGKQS
jgi:hypothetical protein